MLTSVIKFSVPPHAWTYAMHIQCRIHGNFTGPANTGTTDLYFYMVDYFLQHAKVVNKVVLEY